jgi:zinc protease
VSKKIRSKSGWKEYDHETEYKTGDVRIAFGDFDIQADIQAEQDQPGIVAEEAFRKTLFKGSPYGHPVNGSMEALEKTSREEVVQFHRQFYRPNFGILAVVGDIDRQAVQSAIEAPLKAWTAAEAVPESFESKFAVGPQVIESHRPIDQAHIVLGHQGIARSNRDYYALSVMNQILGAGGFSSRLMNAIRVRRGLAYSVHSAYHAHKARGSFMVVLQTQNSTAVQAVRLAIDEIEKIRKEGVTEQELSTAKKYLIGNFPLQMITRDSFARFIAQVEYYNLGKDYYAGYPSYIESVTRQEVQQAARAYLHPDRYLLSIVADLDKVDLSGLRPAK